MTDSHEGLEFLNIILDLGERADAAITFLAPFCDEDSALPSELQVAFGSVVEVLDAQKYLISKFTEAQFEVSDQLKKIEDKINSLPNK